MTTATITPPPAIVNRVRDIHHEALRLQLSRDPITAAIAAQEPGQPLSKYVLEQCEWRGLDPAPYLEQIGRRTLDRNYKAEVVRHDDGWGVRTAYGQTVPCADYNDALVRATRHNENRHRNDLVELRGQDGQS